MKTEMKMLDNGNYERIISPLQHRCYVGIRTWTCSEYGSDLGKLHLKLEDGDPCEGGWEAEVEVNYCPFCGYKPESKKKEES